MNTKEVIDDQKGTVFKALEADMWRGSDNNLWALCGIYARQKNTDDQ